MKYYILFIASSLLMALNLNGQAPEKFNYQGVARDNSGAPLANQELGLQISILDGENAEYIESHTTITNVFGLYQLDIGGGTPITGIMSDVTWATGNKFIKVEIDPNGGTNYSDLGTTELLSVPYALYAVESATGVQGPQGPQGSQGETGPQGEQGEPGATGPQGPQGAIGAVGPQGSPGVKGDTGDAGPQGPQGPQGDIGLTGNTGPIGPIGPIGPVGPMGNTGSQGPTGQPGPPGAKGDPGNNGPQGPQGVAGPIGNTGAIGPAGPIGPIGPIGNTGPQGPQGAVGPQGNVGPQGPAGAAGTINGVSAGGDLSGTYPNPSIKANAVTTAKIANGSVTGAKLDNMGASNGQVLKYNGSIWVPGAASAGWGLSGNSVSSTNFIGTTNNQPLRFKQNNQEVGFIKGDNIALGYGADIVGSNITNATAIGAYAEAWESNTIILGRTASWDSQTGGYLPSTKVGIGTFLPSDELHVVGNSKFNGEVKIAESAFGLSPHLSLKGQNGYYTVMEFQNDYSSRLWTVAAKSHASNENAEFKIGYTPDSGVAIDVFRVSGQGKVGINYFPSSTSIWEGMLSVKGNSGVDNLSLISTNGTAKWGLYVYNDLALFYNGSFKGGFNITSGAYSTTSDSRLKENITPVNSVLDKVQDIKIMSYTYKADKEQTPQIGYIAEELEKQFPEFVTAPDPNSERESFYTVNYAGMSAVAIKAIQEQQELIEKQAQEIETMRDLLQRMESRLDKLEK